MGGKWHGSPKRCLGLPVLKTNCVCGGRELRQLQLFTVSIPASSSTTAGPSRADGAHTKPRL